MVFYRFISVLEEACVLARKVIHGGASETLRQCYERYLHHPSWLLEANNPTGGPEAYGKVQIQPVAWNLKPFFPVAPGGFLSIALRLTLFRGRDLETHSKMMPGAAGCARVQGLRPLAEGALASK